MPRTRRAYPPEFRQQIVELHRAGRSPGELAREFEPNEQTIRNWIAQADLDEGRRRDGLTTVERAELRKLRKENRQLRVEREILAKAAAWFARRAIRFPRSLQVRESESGRRSNHHHVPFAGCLHQWLLRVGRSRTFDSR